MEGSVGLSTRRRICMFRVRFPMATPQQRYNCGLGSLACLPHHLVALRKGVVVA